jgi:hypothetical protein
MVIKAGSRDGKPQTAPENWGMEGPYLRYFRVRYQIAGNGPFKG